MSELSIADIREFPTVSGDVLARHPEFCSDRLHESLFRSYQILERVKWLLSEGASSGIVMREIAEMESVRIQPAPRSGT